MIRLVASDVDGTLVEDGAAKLPEGMAQTIEELVDCGVVFVAASGRSVISIENLFGRIKHKIYYAGCNGTLVGRYHDIMFTELVDGDMLRAMVADIKKYDCAVPFLTGAGTMYAEERDRDVISWLSDGYHEKIMIVDDLASVTAPCVKLSIYDKNLDSAGSFKPFVEKWHEDVMIVTAGTMWLDVIKKGVDKGTALRRLQESLKISREETLAIGDQRNDIGLLKAAGISVAIGNALPEVKAIADYVADTNLELGAMKVFRRMIEERTRLERASAAEDQ